MGEQGRTHRTVAASTRSAVESPGTFTLISGVGGAFGGFVAFGDLRAVLAMAIAAATLSWFIWRPKSPIARRVRERMEVEERNQL